MTAVLPPSRAMTLLESRKAALQAMIAERFRQARAAGTKADVSQLSAALRQVKHSMATATGHSGSV
jgi:hypothetical protein